MFINFFGDLAAFFGVFISKFYDSLLSLSDFLSIEFGITIGDEFIANATANFGIALYFFFFFIVGFLLFKFITFLFNLFFVR